MKDDFSDGLLGIKVFNHIELVDAIIVEGRKVVVGHINRGYYEDLETRRA